MKGSSAACFRCVNCCAYSVKSTIHQVAGRMKVGPAGHY